MASDSLILGNVLKTACVVLATCASAVGQDLDKSFNPGANSHVTVLAVQGDGKILVGGAFRLLGGGGCGATTRSYIARLNPDGSLDATFDPGANGAVYDLAVQEDGKIVVGGAFTMLGGGGTGTTPRSHIARLNPDGSLDTSFDPGANLAVFDVALQADGKIVVGGAFGRLGGGGTGTNWINHIGRLNADGTFDPGFDPGANSTVNTLAVQADGRIVVGGHFTTLGGGGFGAATRNHIGRLNADGSLDTGFDPGADGAVVRIALQRDGRILLGGTFTALGAGGTGTTTRNYLGRLNADGSLDTGFNPGANDSVWGFAEESDGRVVVGGWFTRLGGGETGTTTRNYIARLNPDGSLDATFDPGANAGATALASRRTG